MHTFANPVLICYQAVLSRVVSPEISSGKFPEIYFNLSGNFRKFIFPENFRKFLL